jgi:cytochrome b involved in lipid metabolism
LLENRLLARVTGFSDVHPGGGAVMSKYALKLMISKNEKFNAASTPALLKLRNADT